MGGDHYNSPMQHWDLISENFGSSYLIGCATKYIARHRHKKSGKEDLEKAAHYVQKLIEYQIRFCDDAPFVGMDVITIEHFCQANQVNDNEHTLLHWLLGDCGMPTLEEAQALLERMIKDQIPVPE